ncbi:MULTISPECIES: serine protease [unclassified Microcoleus]|uniref:serine protease n=1 Tax=unclassified Microcoleus TaxID=2642155 RepID=UPI002FD0E900
MNKGLIRLTLVVGLAAALGACGGDTTTPSSPSPSPGAGTTNPPVSSPSPKATPTTSPAPAPKKP